MTNIQRKNIEYMQSKLEEMSLIIKDSNSLLRNYEGSYTLYQIERNCDKIAEQLDNLRDRAIRAQDDEE